MPQNTSTSPGHLAAVTEHWDDWEIFQVEGFVERSDTSITLRSGLDASTWSWHMSRSPCEDKDLIYRSYPASNCDLAERLIICVPLCHVHWVKFQIIRLWHNWLRNEHVSQPGLEKQLVVWAESMEHHRQLRRNWQTRTKHDTSSAIWSETSCWRSNLLTVFFKPCESQ